MLAAHRDQENLVHSHQVPTKQAPKTPGARYPKTPLKQNDENAPTALAGKTDLGGAQAQGKDKIMTTKGKGAATPMRMTTCPSSCSQDTDLEQSPRAERRLERRRPMRKLVTSRPPASRAQPRD